MAEEGPTTTGSINAKLTLDDSDFMAKLAAADAAARKLGSVDPRISVDVDDNGAITKLAAVDEAAKKLDGSTNRLNLSQKALNDTNGGGVQRWQLIAAAIAALIPLLAPLAGYAVGVAGALAGMGAAGVLGIYGIIQAIKQATVVGGQYKSGLAELKSSLDALGSTAANAMLGAFQTAIKTINGALPELNSQIRTFASILGAVGNALLTGVVSALRILNPLFVQASKYVLDLAKGFQQWTQDGSLQKFANYAITQLPIVAQTLGSLAAAALHIVEALAPLGTVVLQGLTLFGAAINAIPLPVLLDVATAAAAGFAAFKLWGLIQPILSAVAAAIGAVGVSTQLAAGPIGWITAGISALAAVLGVNAVASQQAAQAASEYAQAIKEDNDAIGESTRAVAAKRLQDLGALDAAKKIGASLKDVTSATLGNSTAQYNLAQTMQHTRDNIMEQSKETGHLTTKQQEQIAALELLGPVIGGQNAQINEQVAKAKQLSAATEGANSNIATSTDVITAMKNATDAAAESTDSFAKELAGLGQVNLDASQANIQYQQSLADAEAQVKANGRSLDVTTEAGRKNMSALNDIASSAIKVTSANAQAGASSADLTTQMAASRQAFINAAIAAGATADQANKLADQYGLIPANVNTAFHTSGLDEAVKKVQDLQNWIDNLHGKTVTIAARARAGVAGGPLQAFADGGTVQGAGGPKSDKVPALLSPGEEVLSNPYAGAWRPVVKLMNSGASKLQVAQMVNNISGAQAAPASVVRPVFNVQVISNGVDLSKFIDVRIDAAEASTLTTVNGGGVL
ncbi:hypothetical protein [Leifsonia poae]|uniref:hypothetical protein n=1 Tax=Leifsonia poae TaxID=110933 RepID=UPI003D676D78